MTATEASVQWGVSVDQVAQMRRWDIGFRRAWANAQRKGKAQRKEHERTM
jgi:hypothetical protein